MLYFIYRDCTAGYLAKLLVLGPLLLCGFDSDAVRPHSARKAMADQLAMGRLAAEDMAAVERAVCLQLGL